MRRSSRWSGALLLLVCGCLDPRAPGNLVPPTVAEDPSLPAITLRDGVRIHAETVGDPSRPVLILLHGGPGGDYRALRALDALSERYLLVYWDQRGAGLSQRVPVSQLKLAPYLGDLDELVERFSPGRKVTLVGHSFGGAFAAAYTNLFPQKVAQLAMLDPASLVGGAGEEEVIDFTAFWEQPVQEYLEYDDVVSSDDEELRDFRFYRVLADARHELVLQKKLWRGGISAAVWLTDQLNRNGFNFTSNAGSYKAPVLFLTPPDGASPFGATFQSLQSLRYLATQITLIPNSTHLSMVGDPQTLAALKGYLTEYQP